MNKVSIRELLEQEMAAHESLLDEMLENGQVHVHLDELEDFVKAAMQFGVCITVSTKIGDRVRIYAA